jgi:hypothetical protein
MWRVLAQILVVAGCKDSSGTARKVSAERPAVADDAPEPPGGPPSCADVAAHLVAALAVPDEMHAQANGADVTVSGDTMRDGMERGIAKVCRSHAWSHEARECAMGWQGNLLRERAALRDACPGTVK